MTDDKGYIDQEYQSGIATDTPHPEPQPTGPILRDSQFADASNHDDAPTSLIPATKEFFTHAFDFTSRATRADFWWATLGLMIITVALGVVLSIMFGVVYSVAGSNGASWVILLVALAFFVMFAVAMILPTISRSVRRLRDVNMPALLGLLWLISSIGDLFFFVISLIPTAPEGQKTRRQTEFTPAHVGRNWLLYGLGVFVVVGLIAAVIIGFAMMAPDESPAITSQLNNL